MSTWNDIEDEDISINFLGKEVEILAGNNNSGTIYAVITFKQIKNLFEKIQNDEQATGDK